MSVRYNISLYDLDTGEEFYGKMVGIRAVVMVFPGIPSMDRAKNRQTKIN